LATLFSLSCGGGANCLAAVQFPGSKLPVGVGSPCVGESQA